MSRLKLSNLFVFHFSLLLIMVGVLSCCTTNSNSNKVLDSLSNRLLSPEDSKSFIFEEIHSPQNDMFELSTDGSKILIKGNSPIAMASGLNWYLKYYCNSSVSWSGNQIDIPDPLPKIDGIVSKESNFKYSYYLNYCTFNYTMSFWDWGRREQEKD